MTKKNRNFRWIEDRESELVFKKKKNHFNR